MTVEDQVVAASAAIEPRGDVEALLHERKLPGFEPIGSQPVEHELPSWALVTGGAVNFAERQRQIDQLLPVDPRDHLIRRHALPPSASCFFA